MRSLLLGAALLASLLSCTRASPPLSKTSLSADHPLVGRIAAVAEGQPIGWPELLQRAEAAQFVLLGETHDNPEHHRLQARIVTELAASGRRAAVVFEMIDVGRQAQVDELLEGQSPDPDAWAERLEWEASGWPAFALYRPLFAAVLAARLPVLAAGVPSGSQKGDPAWRARFGLDEPLPQTRMDALVEEMFVSHCELLAREKLGPMVSMQRLRDARLADVLLRGAGREGRAILVAGAGHVRESGVPATLVRAGVARPSILAVGLLEVEADRRTVEEVDIAGFDVVLFTARAEREDPCEQLRRRLADRAAR